jgi:hypothetical protein
MNRRPPLFRSILWLIVPLLGGLAGCGGASLPQVKGKVFFKDEPAVGAMVIFHPVADKSYNAVKPYGTVEADGTFRLTTRDPSLGVRDGIPAGDYAVTVYWPRASTQKLKGAAEERQEEASRLPPMYSSAETSGLKATISSSTTELDPFRLR